MRCLALILAVGFVALPSSSWCAEDPPAIVALTLDTSGSISPQLIEQTRSLAVSILEALPAGSEVALFVFDDTSRMILPRTGDPEAVREALAQVKRAGQYTALYDALYDASRYLQEAPRSRKALVLVTDGKDEHSTLLQGDGLKVATDARIPVFAVGVGRIEEAVLARIARLTGGDFTSMASASAEKMALRIAALAPIGEPTAPSTAPVVAAPPPRPAPPLAAIPANLLLLFAVAVLGVFAILIAVAIRLRPAPGPAPRSASPPAPSPGLSLTGVRPAGADASQRGLELDPVDKTIVLRGLPALRVMSGPSTGRMLELEPGREATVGRDASNDLEVADASVSSRHCKIVPEGAGFAICDLESTNGTTVNGERIERRRLTEGDVITIGAVRITYGRG